MSTEESVTEKTAAVSQEETVSVPSTEEAPAVVEENMVVESDEITPVEETSAPLDNKDETSVITEENPVQTESDVTTSETVNTEDGSVKRTRSEDEQPTNEEPAAKKANTSEDTVDGTTEGAESFKNIEVSSNLAGYIVGSRGETIRRLESNSGARIRLSQDGGSTRTITITGTDEAIEAAAVLIEGVITTEKERAKARRPQGEEEGDGIEFPDRIEFLCARTRVGLIIGRGGEKIKDLQDKSGARIQVVQEGLPPYTEGKPVLLIGSRTAVETARQMIIDVIGDGFILPSNYSLTVFNNPDGSVNMELPSALVGIVIGRQGETIKEIQTETEAKIELGQDNGEPLRSLVITGPKEGVRRAFSKIMTIVDESKRRDESLGRGFGANMPVHTETHAFHISIKVVGLVIGRGGETIHAIQDQTGAKVQLENNAPPNALEKRFIITGTMEQIEHAKTMIWERVGDGPMPMSYNLNAGQGGFPMVQRGYPQQHNPMNGGYGNPGYGVPPMRQFGNWDNQRQSPYQNGWGAMQQQGQSPAMAQNTSSPAQTPQQDQWAAAWQQYYQQQASGNPSPNGNVNATATATATATAANAAPGQNVDYSQQWADYYKAQQQQQQQGTQPAQTQPDQAQQPRT
eukprot:Ihof_evm9s83 gene=Ihof_evmTU9s83